MSALRRKKQREEKVKNFNNKVIVAIFTSVIVGTIITYFIPLAGSFILLVSIAAWNFFSGQWYDEGKFKVTFLGFTAFAFVGWLLIFTAMPADNGNSSSWCFISCSFLFIVAWIASGLALGTGLALYYDQRKKRKNRMPSIPLGLGCTV
ncbi:MAG: hypothetical protein ABIJ81_00830 [Patescibacteria group bacterium]